MLNIVTGGINMRLKDKRTLVKALSKEKTDAYDPSEESQY